MNDLTKKLFSRINESNKKINDLKSSLQMQKNAQMYKIQDLEKKNKTIAEAYKIQEKQLKNYYEYMKQMKDKMKSLEQLLTNTNKINEDNKKYIAYLQKENRKLKRTNKQYLKAINKQEAYYKDRENKIKDIVQNPEQRRLNINF
jgi:replicative superfamily II helicase